MDWVSHLHDNCYKNIYQFIPNDFSIYFPNFGSFVIKIRFFCNWLIVVSFIFCLHFDCTNCLVLKIKYPFQYINSYCSHEIKHDFPFRLSLNLCNKLFRLVRIYRSSAINRRAGKWKFSSRLPIVAFIQMSRNIICISTEDRSRRLWRKVTYSLTWPPQENFANHLQL